MYLVLVLFVNDSEYSQSTGAKPIFMSLLAVFISFPWRAVRSYPTPRLFLGGRESTKKKNRLQRRGLALGHGCVGVGVVGVGVVTAWR